MPRSRKGRANRLRTSGDAADSTQQSHSRLEHHLAGTATLTGVPVQILRSF
jgi:hypothetical protein